MIPMSFLSSRQIAYLAITEGLIEPGDAPAFWPTKETTWDDNWRERLSSIEGNAFDFRIRDVHVPGDDCTPYIGAEERRIPESHPYERTVPGDPEAPWHLDPWQFYLLQSQERLRIPVNMGVVLDSRTSVFRSTGGLFFGPVHPGFNGVLTIGCIIFNRRGMLVDPLARMITGRFFYFQDAFGSEAYDGIWNGERWTTEGDIVRAF